MERERRGEGGGKGREIGNKGTSGEVMESNIEGGKGGGRRVRDKGT